MASDVISTSTPATRWFARVCGMLVLTGGVVSALGWITGFHRLFDWDNDGINIKFNSSLCVILLGLGLLFAIYYPRYTSAVRALGGIAAAIAFATLLEHFFSVNFGIDTLFFNEAPGALGTVSPNRMGIPAASSFTLLGVALIFGTFGKRFRRYSATLSITVLVITALSLTGYLYGASQLFSVPQLTAIALQTALMIAVLAVGIAASTPEHGIVCRMLDNDAAGVMLRRTVPLLLFVIVLFGRFLLYGFEIGLYDSAFRAAIRTVFEMVVLISVLAWTARHVAATENASVKAANALSEATMQRRIAATQEKERTRLARDLHDHIGQEVTGLRFTLERICSEKESDSELIADVRKICDKMLKLDGEISNLAWRMRPTALDNEGIAGGLRRLGEECAAIHDIEFDFHASHRVPPLPADVETNIYRIAQEAMNNVVKHSQATRVGVVLDCVNGQVRLAVEDDGRGFTESPDAIHHTDGGGFGLMGMRERASIVGGTLDIETQPGNGTTVLLEIPLNGDGRS